jgi:hypothetical protein
MNDANKTKKVEMFGDDQNDTKASKPKKNAPSTLVLLIVGLLVITGIVVSIVLITNKADTDDDNSDDDTSQTADPDPEPSEEISTWEPEPEPEEVVAKHDKNQEIVEQNEETGDTQVIITSCGVDCQNTSRSYGVTLLVNAVKKYQATNGKLPSAKDVSKVYDKYLKSNNEFRTPSGERYSFLTNPKAKPVVNQMQYSGPGYTCEGPATALGGEHTVVIDPKDEAFVRTTLSDGTYYCMEIH